MADELVQYDPEQLGERVFHLRKAGLSFTDIQAMLDPSPTRDQMVDAYRRFARTLATSYGVEERKQMLFMELERLDALQSAAWQRAMMGDATAITKVLDVMKHRARLTMLDQPTVDTSHTTNILITGNDKDAFIEALIHGRQSAVTSTSQDDEDDLEV